MRINSLTGHKWFYNQITKMCIKKQHILFDGHMYGQLLGTAMRAKCAPPYASLTVGYLEETKLFTNKLPKYFNES